jgi:CRISPR-associated protein Cmr1
MKTRRKMDKLSVNMKLVSPAFMGGSDPKKAELRTASIRGLLRFWWRATQPPMSPVKLLEKESALFGGTETGQSKFLLQISEDRTQVLRLTNRLKPGTAYLSYGLDQSRTALWPGAQFTLQLLFKKGHEENKRELADALWALSYLGGMGSRSRRGFGSVVVTKLEGADFPTLPGSAEELRECIEGKFRELKLHERDGLPEYTALSSRTMVRVLPLGTKSWEEALHRMGDRLNAYRSSQKTERFHDDRDLILDYVGGREPDRAPRRAAFGLPHNYFFKHDGTKVNVTNSNKDSDRRASPLFIHLHELRGGDLAAVLSLISAKFLPENDLVKIGPAGRQSPRNVPPPDFGAVEGFLSSLGEALEVNP